MEQNNSHQEQAVEDAPAAIHEQSDARLAEPQQLAADQPGSPRHGAPVNADERQQLLESDEAYAAERGRQPQSPHIYVSSLADYNQGQLHGVWIDATRDLDDMREEIEEMLCQSPVLLAEDETTGDWAIHDSVGFAMVTVHEQDDLETVHRLAVGIEKHGAAFSAWAEVFESNPEQCGLFQEAYLGEYDDLDSYGEQLWDDMGRQGLIDSVLPAKVARHTLIGAHSLANDLWLGGDIQIVYKPGGGIWVFRGDISTGPNRQRKTCPRYCSRHR